MPEMTGTEFLRRVKALFPATVRIVLSGYTDLNSVIDAVNRGAIHKFLTKPMDKEVLLDIRDDAFHFYEIERDNRILTKQLQELIADAESSQRSRPILTNGNAPHPLSPHPPADEQTQFRLPL